MADNVWESRYTHFAQKAGQNLGAAVTQASLQVLVAGALAARVLSPMRKLDATYPNESNTRGLAVVGMCIDRIDAIKKESITTEKPSVTKHNDSSVVANDRDYSATPMT